jgi:hypothetical protein
VNFPSGGIFCLGLGLRKKVRILGIWGRGVEVAKKIEKNAFFRGQIKF